MKILYETDRLIIRQWLQKDKYDLYEYASDPNVTKYLSFPTYTSMQDAVDRINKLRKQYKQSRIDTDYCIQLKNNTKVIGSIGLHNYTTTNDGEIEIGYVLNSKYQGNGYMTEALKGMIEYIHKNHIAKRISANHNVENVRSGNVMKRAGMTKEGVLRRAGKSNHYSRFDVAVYSILDEEIK